MRWISVWSLGNSSLWAENLFLANKGGVYTFRNGSLKKEVSIEGDFTYYDNLILGKKWLILVVPARGVLILIRML